MGLIWYFVKVFFKEVVVDEEAMYYSNKNSTSNNETCNDR